jgi:hypothetical protein
MILVDYIDIFDVTIASMMASSMRKWKVIVMNPPVGEVILSIMMVLMMYVASNQWTAD